jgi:hypothetical protein
MTTKSIKNLLQIKLKKRQNKNNMGVEGGVF